MPLSPIRYVTREQLDTDKWDRCIHDAPNGLIYGYSFYLDTMARHWDALVAGDYETVMPLPWNQKWGIAYLYQPAFTATLGIFGHCPDEATAEAFLKAIPKKFSLIEIDLNSQNQIPSHTAGLIWRTNYVLSLDQPYEQLKKKYREHIRRNLQKAQEWGCSYQENIPVEDVLMLWKQQRKFSRSLEVNSLDRFSHLCKQFKQQQHLVGCGVYSPKGQLLAGVLFLLSHHRAYYILAGNHPEGKNCGASPMLIDRFIAARAGTHLVLDFEGSDKPGLAFFYSSFGASPESYPALRMSRLPSWINNWKGKLFGDGSVKKNSS